MRAVVLALAWLVVASAHAAAADAVEDISAVRTTWRADDAAVIARALLEAPDVRTFADARAPLVLRIDVRGGEDATFRYADGDITPTLDAPDYAVRLDANAALAMLNAPEPHLAGRCLFDAGALLAESAHAHERLAMRAAKGRAGALCVPPDGAQETAPGLFVLGDRAYDRIGIPLGWQDIEAPRHLGRADAGISRLPAEALPRAPVDLADPWLAATAPAMRALLAQAADCPCEAPAPLVPAGDWRAALAADPRAREGTR